MNKYYAIGAGIVAVLLIVFVAASSGSPKRTPTQPSAPAQTVATNPIPAAQVVASSTAQGAEDIVPGLYPNPIKNAATAKGFKIASMMVENNTDAGGNAVSDHLQFTLQNLTSKTLSNFEVYYTIVDAANGKKEGYYKQLAGFSLPPNGSGTVHFDGGSAPGHYGVNMHGIYGTTVDTLKFSVEVSTPGYAPVTANITKAPGGAEVVGQ